uniref:Antitoxin n=1 Tax=Tanacetum cinerariifolium TaxID=118510 RepID=A0A699GF10_TANCI|nr:hypothetical protein [Tanacetum cinerariifolium]
MSALRDLAKLEIRTFGSFEEVEALEQFELNAPLSPANYKRLYGDYHTLEKVRCCVQKENGKLCEEPHNHGWLAERIDGKLTLVGGDCAVKKFGADRRLATDLSHYLNEKNRKARIVSLAEAIAAKDTRLDALRKIHADVKVLESRVRSFTGQLGTLTIRRIQDMIRTQTFEVVVVATRRRTETDSKGSSNPSAGNRRERQFRMNILTFREVRARLKAVMDDVCTNHSPTIITRQSGDAVVMLSLADFNSIEETLCLLGSPKNAKRLLESMEQLKIGNARKRELTQREEQKGKQQGTS